MTEISIGEPFSKNAFQRVLVDPAVRGSDELYVISGYSSPSMVVRHFDALRAVGTRIALDLQVGMTSSEGISRFALSGFQSVHSQVVGGRLSCRLNTGTTIHSKLYVWCDSDGPREAFIGSGNYTQTGFGVGARTAPQEELFVSVNPGIAFDHIVRLSGQSVQVDDPEIENLVSVSEIDPEYFQGPQDLDSSIDPGGIESVLLPLVQTTKSPGSVHNEGGGLNWGQRGRRNPSEAYIPIPSRVRESHFFPEKGVRFQILTSDGETFVATVAQQGNKAIETPEDNSIIGAYFRRKLGLLPGQFVRTEDLESFGSNAVRFSRVDDDLYLMTFEPGLDFFSS